MPNGATEEYQAAKDFYLWYLRGYLGFAEPEPDAVNVDRLEAYALGKWSAAVPTRSLVSRREFEDSWKIRQATTLIEKLETSKGGQ